MKAFGIAVTNYVVAIRSKVNELVAMLKVIMMAMGKTLIMGNALECKGKEKIPKLRLDVGERNA